MLIEDRFFDEPLQGFNHSHNASEVFRTCSPFVFVSTAESDGVRLKRGADVKNPGALWTMKFMRADRHEIGIELLNAFERFFAEPLNGIGMKNYAFFAADSAKLRDRLDRSDLIIGSHE